MKRRSVVCLINIGLLTIFLYAWFSYNHRKAIVNREKEITNFSVLEINCSGGKRRLTWEKFGKIWNFHIPNPRIRVHPKDYSKSRMRENRTYGSVRGGQSNLIPSTRLTGPLAPRVADCCSAAMLIKSALRSLLSVSNDMKTILLTGSLRSPPPYPGCTGLPPIQGTE